MSLEDTLRVLERAPLFAEIRRDALRLLAFSGEEMALREGERLFQGGTPAEGAFVVLSGAVRLVVSSRKNGSERRVGPSTLIGGMALLIPTERPCDAFGAEPSVLLSIPRPLFRRMLTEFPDIAAQLRQKLVERIGGDQSALMDVATTLRGLDRA
jgi:CRP-like cAMP-binding protein